MALPFDLLTEVKDAKTIGISGHIRPDGDCIGSTCAMYLYLKKCCPDKSIKLFLENPADIFDDIPCFGEIDCTYEATEPFDVFIAIDCEKSRLGKAEAFFDQARKTINIDHHISNEKGSGDVNYVVPSASSASELVYDLLEKDMLDADIAAAIYLGIAHDTGVFQYSNTSPKTLRIVADLLEYQFDFSKLLDRTFYEKTYHQNQILGRALLESIIFMNRKCIMSAIDKKTLEFYKVGPKDLEGIVSQLRYTKEVECAIFMYELEPQVWKVSLRSNGLVDVAKVAGFFGGGGHVRAAGVTMNGTCHDVINNLSGFIEKQLEEAGAWQTES